MNSLVEKGKYSKPINRSAIAANWRKRGYSCDVFVDPPGRHWKDFVHSSNELLAVAEGRLEVTIVGESFVAEPGDEVFIPRGALHSVRNIDAGVTHWLFGYEGN